MMRSPKVEPEQAYQESSLSPSFSWKPPKKKVFIVDQHRYQKKINEKAWCVPRADRSRPFGEAFAAPRHCSTLTSARCPNTTPPPPRYIIDPRHSKFMRHWDLCTVAALVFTAIVTPVEVSFLTPPSTPWDGLFLINRLVDLVFIVDFCLSFILMYPASPQRPSSPQAESSPQQLHTTPALSPPTPQFKPPTLPLPT